MNEFNLELHNRIIAQIEKDPDNWNQDKWECGTAHCYGGWAILLSGEKTDFYDPTLDVKKLLNLSWGDTGYVISPCRTLKQLKALPEYIKSNRENPK